MSFQDLSQKLTEIRTHALRKQACGFFDALDASVAAEKCASIKSVDIDINKLTTLCDRVNNCQGVLTELYQEARQYGVPEQAFMQVDTTKESSTPAAPAGNIQKAFRKITLRVTANGKKSNGL